MPAIDLSRLRKQASRLADFFFLPDEFLKHLREMLDFYVNHTIRVKENVTLDSDLKKYHTPVVVVRQIESQIRDLAEQNPEDALNLADLLWDENALEMGLLAAFLLGRIPPQEERLLPRLTAWTQQVYDPDIRAALLSNSFTRMRRETPEQFLTLVREWLHPERVNSWSNGIQALIPMIAETSFENLPPVIALAEPIIEAAPSTLQVELTDLILALHKASPMETTFMLKQILTESENPMTAITLRRIQTYLPAELQTELRDLLRAKPKPQIVFAKDSADEIVETEAEPTTPVPVEKPRKERKSKKKTVEAVEAEVESTPSIPVEKPRKPRKSKKQMATDVVEAEVASTIPTSVEKPQKERKAKKQIASKKPAKKTTRRASK